MKKLTNNDVDARLIGRPIIRVGEYVDTSTLIEWKCTTCGHGWLNMPDRVIGKKQTGCPKCSNRQKLTDAGVDARLPSTIRRVENVKQTHTPMLWECNDCQHQWRASPNNVLNKNSGCPRCKDKSLTNTKVDARLAGRSIRRLDDIVNTHTRIRWQCTTCSNEWSTSPASVVNELSGCPRCARLVSTGELSWLDHHAVPNDAHHRQVIIILEGTKYKVDGFMPETNTVYEYWGDYWHGNPNRYEPTAVHPITKKTYGELYAKTQEKRQRLINAGYTLVEVWDSEWRMLTSNRKKSKL